MATTCILAQPLLLECEPKTIAAGVIRSAQLGLALDPLLGESYLIPRWNSKNKRMEASWQRGYRGVLKLIRRTGELSGVRADVVHEKDKFMRTANGDIFHEKAEGDRGKRIRAYVVMYFKEGFILAYDMDAAEVLAIRDRYSEGYKAFAAGKIADNPWNPENPQAEKWMWIKTAIFQAAHLAPMETEAGQQLVKEAIREELPPDTAMDDLSAEIFDGEAPIEIGARTEERLSRTEALTQQLAGETAKTPAEPAASNDASKPEEPKAEPIETKIPEDPERGAIATQIVQARDNIFKKLIDGDRFVAARTEKYTSVDELFAKGTSGELQQVLADMHKFADQRAKATEG